MVSGSWFFQPRLVGHAPGRHGSWDWSLFLSPLHGPSVSLAPLKAAALTPFPSVSHSIRSSRLLQVLKFGGLNSRSLLGRGWALLWPFNHQYGLCRYSFPPRSSPPIHLNPIQLYWEPTACHELVLHDLLEKIVLCPTDGNNCLDIVTVHQTLSLSTLHLLILR